MKANGKAVLKYRALRAGTAFTSNPMGGSGKKIETSEKFHFEM
jgi:hypothetical protein